MNWIEVTARFDRSPEDWGGIIELFDWHGSPNTLQTDEPPSLTGSIVEVPGSEEKLAMLRADLMAAGASAVDIRVVPEQDWQELWKQHFKPIRIGRRFLVRPTWEDGGANPEDRVITLDPGQAFGTGDHPTTKLCLQLMEELPIAGKAVLDIGCGSGILSIGACLLGAAEVVAVDIDPLAVEVAKENAAINRVCFRAEVSDGIGEVSCQARPWDVILSNIISATLIGIADDVYAELSPGGQWLVSGIIPVNWPAVLETAESVGFRLQNKVEEDGWVAAVLSR